ncbi:hypothetical protein ACFXKW_37165 [Streptomyces sp. NPDC059193]|uniref:hypothetical protein n=1 Tax=Streptomyces sp. NPDC059193 TaxID=3346763 RepID=UPI00368380AF
MKNTIPRGSWLEADAFRKLVQEIAPLRLGGWSLSEFERATSALGWELEGPSEVAGQIWRQFLPRKGPMGGYGTVVADTSQPEQIHTLRIPVVDMPADDVRHAADMVRAAWWIMEEELGPPTLWGGNIGPWMLWRRPGSSLIVYSDSAGHMDLELVHTDADADAAARGDSRGSWRATDPAHLPPALAAPARTSTRWDEVQERLHRALCSLNYDTPFFPGRFILHLGSAHDPQRFVQCWSDGLDLVIEATGYVHHPELADPARLTESGWKLSHSLWQRRFPDAMEESAHSQAAARMLVGELRNLGIDLADLVHSGTMTGRGRDFHLDLPAVGLRRSQS